MIFVVIVFLLAAIPMMVLCAKRIFQATLIAGAELHDVVGSTARASFTLGFNADGSMRFLMNVRNISGPPSGTHIHSPAAEDQNAPVLLSLCGAPAPSAAGDCTFVSDTNTLTVNANITPPSFAMGCHRGAVYPAIIRLKPKTGINQYNRSRQ